jgi:hypothetical protein
MKKTMILLFGLSTGLSCVANDESLAVSKADTETSEVVLNAVGSESENDSSSKGGYVLEGNKNLKLCHEFLEALNDKPVNYYATPKPIDKKFPQFVPIKMTPVDKDKYFPDMEDNRMNTLPEDEFKRNVALERWRYNKEEYFSSNSETFVTGNIDVNHDGKMEQFFVQSILNYTDKYLAGYYFELMRDDKIVHGETIVFRGIPFIYKGRFYFVDTGKDYALLHEPSLPYKKSEGFRENPAICRYFIEK